LRANSSSVKQEIIAISKNSEVPNGVHERPITDMSKKNLFPISFFKNKFKSIYPTTLSSDFSSSVCLSRTSYKFIFYPTPATCNIRRMLD